MIPNASLLRRHQWHWAATLWCGIPWIVDDGHSCSCKYAWISNLLQLHWKRRIFVCKISHPYFWCIRHKDDQRYPRCWLWIFNPCLHCFQKRYIYCNSDSGSESEEEYKSDQWWGSMVTMFWRSCSENHEPWPLHFGRVCPELPSEPEQRLKVPAQCPRAQKGWWSVGMRLFSADVAEPLNGLPVSL